MRPWRPTLFLHANQRHTQLLSVNSARLLQRHIRSSSSWPPGGASEVAGSAADAHQQRGAESGRDAGRRSAQGLSNSKQRASVYQAPNQGSTRGYVSQRWEQSFGYNCGNSDAWSALDVALLDAFAWWVHLVELSVADCGLWAVLGAAHEARLDCVIDQLLQDFLQVCPEDYGTQFVQECLPLLFNIFRYSKVSWGLIPQRSPSLIFCFRILAEQQDIN